MAENTDLTQGVGQVDAQRISTCGRDSPKYHAPRSETVTVIREAPVVIDVEGVESYTLLCTPTDTLNLAAGFLLSEGIIDSMAMVSVLRPCHEKEGVVRVKLDGSVPRIGDQGRNLLIVSSCGACGSEGLEEKLKSLPTVEDTLRLDCCSLRSLGQALRDQQVLFDVCGGSHAIGIFDASGSLIATAEDAGRHNALDKAIGKCLREGRSTKGCGAVLSGRVSLEMVSKCVRAGIELITAVSAPTSLAIEVAERCGLTLCAFVRETRATVFSHPQRVELR